MLCRLTILLAFISIQWISAQDFISVKNNHFRDGEIEFNFLGFNAYYLFSEAAFGKTYIADEVFDAAEETGARVIRTWAFYEADSIENPAVIRPSPYQINENALRALDYVVFKAKQKNLKLILTLANNNAHFGGIPQYLSWGRKYLLRNFLKKDFFTDDSLKTWYKNYVKYILCRVNEYTGVVYKDENAIFSFELINEASNEKHDASLIYDWYREMAAFFKSIDSSHLLTTGEVGEDDDRNLYSDINLFYNSSDFLFNGYKGTSYSENLTIPDIDYGSFHLYTEGWGFHPAAGRNWIKEHFSIADNLDKPSLLSEFGSRNDKVAAYKGWLKEISGRNCRSAVVWQYLHPDVNNSDGFGFNLSDTSLVKIFRDFAGEINKPVIYPELPANAELYQNYPNPFNPVTTIKYSIDADDEIKVELFSSIGERIGILDEGFKKRGTYELILSFDSGIYSSGAYIYSLTTSKGRCAKKLILLK